LLWSNQRRRHCTSPRQRSKYQACKRYHQSPTLKERKFETAEVKWFLFELPKLRIDSKSNILYHRSQVVLPQEFEFRRRVFKELHEDMGHLGSERVLALVRERFYWPYMRRDIEHFVTHVCGCLRQKRPNLPTREPLQSITTTSPFQLIGIDFVHLERSSRGYEYILVVVNHFTRYVQAYILLKTKRVLRPLTRYTTTLSQDLDFLNEFTMIRVKNLRITCSIG
jgi:hypothetical protein